MLLALLYALVEVAFGLRLQSRAAVLDSHDEVGAHRAVVLVQDGEFQRAVAGAIKRSDFSVASWVTAAYWK